MGKTWTTLMESDLLAAYDDWQFTFFDIREDLPQKKILNKNFFRDLLQVLRVNEHYEAIIQIKEIKSNSINKSLPAESCIIISTAGKEMQLNFKLLFHAISEEDYQIVRMWPPDAISTFLQYNGLLEMMIVQLIKSLNSFEHVYVFVPIQP